MTIQRVHRQQDVMKNHLADKTILPIVEPNPAIKIVKDELREAIYLINGAEAALSEEIGF